MKLRQWLIFYILAFLLVVLFACSPSEQAQIQTQVAIIGKTSAAEARQFAETQAAQIKQTAKARISTEGAGAFATLVASQQKAPFKKPTYGLMGLKYKESYGDIRGIHKGIDIWASKDPANGKQLGAPVYAVYDGKLGRTGSGVEICHPKLDINRWTQLPFDLVCTYYGHLTDLQKKFVDLPKDACPNGLVEVKQGDLLGYMDNKDMIANSGIVHLHFSVVKQNPTNGCWTNETNLENTLDPFIYLGLKGDDYQWFTQFP